MSLVLDTRDLEALSQDEFLDENKTLSNVLESISKPSSLTMRRKNDGTRSFDCMLKRKVLKSSQNIKKDAEVVLHPKSGEGKCFATRRIALEVGRSVLIGRHTNNGPEDEVTSGIFDCRVLSRQHAELKFQDDGCFFITDLNSSNGTYVNSAKIPPNTSFQIFNNDTIQFGQDVSDCASNSKHKCIIANVELVSHIKEIKQPDVATEIELAATLGQFEEKEKSLGEKLERTKLLLQQLRFQVQKGWKALIDEDSLLSRIDYLETCLDQRQLVSEDKIKLDESIKEHVLALDDSSPREQMTAELESRVALLERRTGMLVNSQKTTFGLVVYLSILLTLLLVVAMFLGAFSRRSVTLSAW